MRAYLDTNILGNWFLLYRKPRTWRKFKPKDKAFQSMILHEDMKIGKYELRFQTSSWAISELAQTAMDYRLGVKMIREGRTPEFFNKWKRQQIINPVEAMQIHGSLRSFVQHIEVLGVVVTEGIINSERIHDFTLRYGLNAPDATHISIASRHCGYFVTNDEDLCDKKIKEIHVVKPATLETYAHLRRFMPR